MTTRGYSSLLTLAFGIALTACSGSGNDRDMGTGGSGGSGATGAGASGGSGAGGGAAPTCSIAANGTNRLIDDFSDDTIGIPNNENRSGGWYMSSDSSSTTGVVTPADAPEFVNGTMHMAATGFDTGWGAFLQTNFTNSGCYDASVHDGIVVVARGSGTVDVRLPSIDTLPPPQGEAVVGYDHLDTPIVLSDSWTTFELPWSMFATQNWGDPVPPPLDGDRILGIVFQTTGDAADSRDFEIWVDEVAFMGSAPIIGSGGGASGGAGGTGGAAGGTGGMAGAGGATGGNGGTGG